MGWNQGWEILEHQVIDIYNLDALTPAVLVAIGKVFADTDIDFGGYEGILAKDGRDAEEIIIRTLGGSMPEKPREERVTWHPEMSTEEEANEAAWDAWEAALYDERRRVTKEHFGW